MQHRAYEESKWTKMDKHVVMVRLNFKDKSFSWDDQMTLVKLLGLTAKEWKDNLPSK